MKDIPPEGISAFISLLGTENVEFDQKTVAREMENTLGLKRKCNGIVYPSNTEEVRKIVEIANKFIVHLYPISRGKNIGYGEKAPVSDGQLIVDLKKMNGIRNFDNTLGFVIVESGVSQNQLYNYLMENNSKYWMDTTGSGLESSIVGNVLEGGFGHTAKGNRRELLSDVEIVLGNGTLLQTGLFPGLGPDLSGLFVQSNFGIITSMRIQLMPIPKHYESFTITIGEEINIEPLVDFIREFRQQNIMTNLVHIANPVRYLMSSMPCPKKYYDKMISCNDAMKISSSMFLKIGYWNVLGGLYGTGKKEINEKKRIISKKFYKIGKVFFFNDNRIKLLEKIFNSKLIRDKYFGYEIKAIKKMKKSINSLSHFHGLMKGIPTDLPLKHIGWKVEKTEDIGLIWFSPTVEATGKAVRKLINIASALFDKFRFDMPVTLTLITPGQIIGIINICFNNKNEEEKKRAYKLYRSLNSEFARENIFPYRSSIFDLQNMKYQHIGKEETFVKLKKIFDPNNIIAPGRYGIKGEISEFY